MSEKAEQTSKEKHLKDWKTITLTPLLKKSDSLETKEKEARSGSRLSHSSA